MAETVIIIGAGGHGKVIADIVRCRGDRVMGFLDDQQNIDHVLDMPILGVVTDYIHYPDASFIVAIGDQTIRRQIVKQMHDIKWYTAIHPAATISTMDVQIGSGTAVMANAVINAGAKVGQHCIINTGAIVEHDNNILDYAHVSVGAKLAGNVVVGKGTWIGIGAVVSQGVTVCDDCMIGAGAVAVKNIEEPGTYVGVPARKIR